MRTRLPFALLATALACSLASAPAQARARVFVASYGSDSNPCTFLSPCRNFQQAVNVVDPGGEVTAIDSAGFGPISIGHAVTITSPAGVEAGIAVAANAAGITINAGPNDAVKLRGLTIQGGGIGGNGIVFSSGGSLIIENCKATDLAGSGIGLVPNANAKIVVSNTLVADNGGHGIYLQPSGNQPVYAVFNRVEAYHNAQKGIGIFGNVLATGVFLQAVIVDSVAAYNTDGFYALGNQYNPFGTEFVRVNRSTTIGNTGAGLHAEINAVIYVSQTDMNDLPTLWVEDSTSCIWTYGDNYTYASESPCSDSTLAKK